MPDITELTKAARILRNAATPEFTNFLKHLSTYTDEVVLAVTEADADRILVAQGRAQQARHLLRVLVECEPPTPR